MPRLVKLTVSMGGDRFSHQPGDVVEVDNDEAQRLVDDHMAEPAPKGAKATAFREPSFAEKPEVFRGPIPRSHVEREGNGSQPPVDQKNPQHGRPNQRPPQGQAIADRRPAAAAAKVEETQDDSEADGGDEESEKA